MKNKTTTPPRLDDARTIERVNALLHKARQRQGLWRTREQCADIKWRAYCKSEGVAVARGGWREGRRHCNTKSQWQWRQERRIAEGYDAQDTTTTKRTTDTTDFNVAIIYDVYGYIQAYAVTARRRRGKTTLQVIVDTRRRVEIQAHKVATPDIKIMIAPDGSTVTAELVTKLALQRGYDIYKLDWAEDTEEI